LAVLRKLTKGKLHLNILGSSENIQAFTQTDGVEVNKFFGKHPAGNVGVQIHHIDPINKGDIVWTVDPVGVSQIGKLFLQGKYDASRIFAVAGSEVDSPTYFKGLTGQSIQEIAASKVKNQNVRFISGNVLTGNQIQSDGYLGFNHHLLTVIPEGDYQEFLGWMLPTAKKLSFQRALGLFSFLKGSDEFVMDTNTRGEERAFVQTGVFEKVVPMDILPTHLIKAIMSEDYDEMEGLGIYEVIEEDLALCEFVDVSKHPIQEIVRDGLELMQNS
jgi:Na+-transporting NADH:ubiquinone oxidoreductase subunit A